MAKKEKEKEIVEIQTTEIGQQMSKDMFEYGMYILENRAVPRITDGLLTGETRILYGMYNQGNTSDGPHRKSARSVGYIMGAFHPHGDQSIYGTFTKLSQRWKTMLPLIEFHGNNGNITGDSPAAMRYTEARLAKVSKFVLDDIRMDTVDMVDNFDGSEKEPVELPSKLPLLLINGVSGIIVGFTSNFPSHNPYDAMELIRQFNLNRNMTVDEMIDIIKAPDLPTGGVINGLESVIEGYKTGKGRLRVRGKIVRDKTKKGYDVLDIIELPPRVKYDSVKESIAALADDGEIRLKERVHDLTDKNGIKIRLVLKSGEDPERVENLLYKKCLESTTGISPLALKDGLPAEVTLHDIVSDFVKFRERVVYRRSNFKKKKAENELHLQKGLQIAHKNMDELISVIRKAENENDACTKLMKKYRLTEVQARYILSMKIGKLTRLESSIVEDKIKKLESEIKVLARITKSESNEHITQIIDDECDEVMKFLKKEGYAKRRTDIIKSKKTVDILDAIKDEPRVLVYTKNGRLKNMNMEFNSQNRRGQGSSFLSQEDDNVELMIPTSTKSNVLLFTNMGKVYSVLPYKIPVSSKSSRGDLAKNLLSLAKDEKIIHMLDVPVSENPKDKSLIFVTEQGLIKATRFAEYTSIRAVGKRAIKLSNKDSLISVFIYDDKQGDDILITTHEGYSIRISGTNISRTGRDTSGVVGIRLKNDKDKVISGIPMNTPFIFFCDEKGNAKQVDEKEFNKQSRGGSGVISGTRLVAAVPDSEEATQLNIITKQGMNITVEKGDIRRVSRSALGVKTIKLSNKDIVIGMIEV